jgi:hypothetical protein
MIVARVSVTVEGTAEPVGVGPVVRDETSMPTRDRVRSDEEDRPAVTAEHASECGEDDAVVGFETRPCNLALHHRELVAQHEDLDIFGTLASTAQHQQVDHEPDKTVEMGHALILTALKPR